MAWASVAALACLTWPVQALAARDACERAELPQLQRILNGRIIDASSAPARDDPAGGELSECRVLSDDWRTVISFVDLVYIRNVRQAMRADVIAARMDAHLITLTIEQPRRADELIRADDGPRKMSYTAAFSYRVATVVVDRLTAPLSAQKQAQLREYAELLVLRR